MIEVIISIHLHILITQMLRSMFPVIVGPDLIKNQYTAYLNVLTVDLHTAFILGTVWFVPLVFHSEVTLGNEENYLYTRVVSVSPELLFD